MNLSYLAQSLLFNVIPPAFYWFWSLLLLFFFIKKKNYFKKVVITGIFLFFILFLIKSTSQVIINYHLWKNDPLSRFLLPPHIPLSYFFHYSYTHYYSSYILAIGGAFLIGILFWMLQKRGRTTSSEIYLAVFGALVSGWPNLIIFLGMTLILAIFYSLLQNYRKGGQKRIFLLFPMIISLILTLLFGNFLVNHLGMAVLRMPTS